MSLADQYPELFSQWEAAGGVDSNFRDHLLGIGVIPATKDDVRHLTEQIQAKMNQLANVVNALPFA